MSRTERRGRAGYTLIEVMMAVAILTAGSVAIMAMHQAATRGNLEARQMTTGTQIAQRWVERLRRDGLNWQTPANGADPLLLAGTSYLRLVSAPGTPATWIPAPAPPGGTGETANFDFYGRDLAAGTAAAYCTNLRLSWIYPGQAMRADVRVWWVRNGDVPAALLNCAAGTDPNTLTGDQRLRMVYTSTVVRYFPRPAP